MTTRDIVAFLRARLAEDAQWARDSASELYADGEEGAPGHSTRVLADVEAKRRLIQRYENAVAVPTSVSSFTRGQDDGYLQACADAIRDAVGVYATHPEYRPEWRP